MHVVANIEECPVEQPHHRWDQRCVGQQLQAQLQVSPSRQFLSDSASSGGSGGSNGSEVGGLAWSGGVSLLIAVLNILLSL